MCRGGRRSGNSSSSNSRAAEPASRPTQRARDCTAARTLWSWSRGPGPGPPASAPRAASRSRRAVFPWPPPCFARVADRGQMDARHVDQPLRQQGEGLLAGSLEGEQAETAATAELVGQQPDGRIAGGNHQGVRRRGRKLLAKLSFLVDAVMADDSQIGGLGGIHEFASGNRGPPIAAGLAVRLPGPGRLAGSRGSELKEVLDPAIQGGGQGQGGGGRWRQPVGLDRTDPGAGDPRPDCQIVLGPSPCDAAAFLLDWSVDVQRTWGLRSWNEVDCPILPKGFAASLGDREEQGLVVKLRDSIAA